MSRGRSTRRRSALERKASRGNRGYPAATLAFYGPTDQFASKVAVGILPNEAADAEIVARLFADQVDARWDTRIEAEVLALLRRYGAKSVVISDGIIGCPHEEGKDYPDGATCPECPFWERRNRWTGEIVG